MTDPPKGLRKEIRRISGAAYEAELGAALREVEKGFEDWRAGRIDGLELSDRIHAFHQGPNRQLYSLYARFKPWETAARAIALGIVSREDVSPDVLAHLERKIETYRALEDL